jgi:hypothetical protein
MQTGGALIGVFVLVVFFTYSLEGLGRVVSHLLDAIGVVLGGHVVAGVVLTLWRGEEE